MLLNLNWIPFEWLVIVVNEETLLSLAHQNYKVGKYTEALEHSIAVYDTNPCRTDNLLLLGAIYYQVSLLPILIRNILLFFKTITYSKCACPPLLQNHNFWGSLTSGNLDCSSIPLENTHSWLALFNMRKIFCALVSFFLEFAPNICSS